MTTAPKTSPERLLVDGYNLIKSVPLFASYEQVSLENARRHLERALRAYSRRTAASIALFFDGDGIPEPQSPQQRDRHLQIHFSRSPETADDLIKRAIQENHGARRLRVITSDREIRRFARRHKIGTTSSLEFGEELESPSVSPKAIEEESPPPEFDPHLTLDEAEIQQWAELFGRKREDR